MKCSICEKRDKDTVKCRRGAICRECLEGLPEAIKRSLKDFTVKQINEAKKIFECETSRSIFRFENLGIDETHLKLNGWQIERSHIKKVYPKFHPKKQIGKWLFSGTVTLVVVTKDPMISVEEPLISKDIAVYVRYIDKEFDWCFPEIIMTLYLRINENLIYEDREDFSSVWEQYEEDERKKRRESYRENNTDYLKPMLEMFGLKMPFSEEELKRSYRILAMNNHPDRHPNNREYATKQMQEINKFNEILRQYVGKEK